MQEYPYPKEYWIISTFDSEKFAQKMKVVKGMWGLDPVYHYHASVGNIFLSEEAAEAYLDRYGRLMTSL